VPAPTKILVYDYVLFASAKVPDAVVAKAVEALFAHPGDLTAASPLFREFDPALMGRDLGIPYHPGAIAFYRAKGVWKGQ
jgi:TRAP-type uncharacterized transport system substrate-binding protein